MAIHIAYKTIKHIDACIEADQGNGYRAWLQKLLPHFDDIYRQETEGFRSHLGASIVGGSCARKIWYSYRWMHKSKFSGRILRLFSRGHTEEARIIAAMLTAGIMVFQQDEKGKQFTISHANGHMGGSGDGFGYKLPDLADNMQTLFEFKTHGNSSFVKLAGKDWVKHIDNYGTKTAHKFPFTGAGVKEAKFEHYVQMLCYMRKMNMGVALYVAVAKDTDAMYMELVPLDIEIADQYLERGRKIVYATTPPKKISQSIGYYECTFCDFKNICHLKAVPAVNCRTCQFSEPLEDGTWNCSKHGTLSKEVQLVGCSDYKVRNET